MFLGLKIAMLTVTLLLALYFDLRYRKIKNFITITAAISGCILNIFEHGMWGFLFSLKGWTIPVAALIILYFINVMGAGDIKLFAAIGSTMGASFAVYTFIFSIYFGAVIALFILIRNRSFNKKMRRLFGYIYYCFALKKLVPYSSRGDYSSKFPFSLAVVPAVAVGFFTTGFKFIII